MKGNRWYTFFLRNPKALIKFYKMSRINDPSLACIKQFFLNLSFFFFLLPGWFWRVTLSRSYRKSTTGYDDCQSVSTTILTFSNVGWWGTTHPAVELVLNESVQTHCGLLFYLPHLSVSPSPCLSSDWCQLMSEPAYGFVLFDYITGNLEAQTDRSQLL